MKFEISERKAPRVLSFSLKSRVLNESIDFDVLPAFNALGKIPRPQPLAEERGFWRDGRRGWRESNGTQSWGHCPQQVAFIPYTCIHFHSHLRIPRMAKIHIFYSHDIIHSIYQRMGYPGVLCTFLDKFPQVLVEESKQQPGGGILRQKQEIWVFASNLRQKSPLEIQFTGGKHVMVY